MDTPARQVLLDCIYMVGCIYCKRDREHIQLSEAHVFPYVMGGSVASDETVCDECNHLVNQRVEMPALASVLPLQSIFGIRGRRHPVSRVPGTLRAEGAEKRVYLNERGELMDAVVVDKRDESGKRSFQIMGPADKVEKYTREIGSADPTLKWKELPASDTGHVEVTFSDSRTVDLLCPLAAKVAFEYFARPRGAQFVSDAEYDPVRAFVLNGVDTGQVAGIVADDSVLNRFLHPFKPPHHVVYITAHPQSTVLGAFVGFYGLFYYWVILSRQYRPLWPLDDLLIQDPQARNAEAPVLRGQTGAVLVDWNRVTAAHRRDRVAANVAAGKHATKRFREAADAFYGRTPSPE